MKKILALLLVTVLALGMCTVSFAASAKVGGYISGLSGDVQDYAGADTELKAGREYFFPIAAADLVDTDGKAWGATVTAKQLKDSKVTIKSSHKTGSQYIDKVEIVDVSGAANIKFKIIDPVVSTKEIDYEYNFHLVFDKTRSDKIRMYHISGQIVNDIIHVNDSDDYVDLSKGHIAEADSYIKAIECDLGNEVYIHTKLFNGKKYYGVADGDISDEDDAVMTKYPEINAVINIKAIGLNVAGNIVELRDYGSETYVYDKDMKYLGTANNLLPYSAKYYLADKKVNSSSDTAEEEEEEEEDGEDVPEDDYVPSSSNINDNPGTGR